ncbi:unnamed protein product [Hydatigera taeniaeformis]|uniref:Uncharacterized protein n=1 Tax=Hydatigena taeniaeformis TaxID=6205 RepID=A0A0R3XBT5_HYDTA|nr:unnamed protein product [Hydatigera taeniaeformis]
MTFLNFEDEEELEGEDGAFKDTIIESSPLRPKPNKPTANSHQGRAPTLTIEVVRACRPLKALNSTAPDAVMTNLTHTPPLYPPTSHHSTIFSPPLMSVTLLHFALRD